MGIMIYETEAAARHAVAKMRGWDDVRIEECNSGDTTDDVKGWCISAQAPGTTSDRVYEQDDGFLR